MPPKLTEAEISDVIQMALSDHVSFNDIRNQYGLAEKDVKKINESKFKNRILSNLAKKSSGFWITA